MGKYYNAIARERSAYEHGLEEPAAKSARGDVAPVAGQPAPVTLPVFQHVPTALANEAAIRTLSERLVPVAAVESSVRLFVTGCRPQDGASAVAAAFAIDLSQRLKLRTMLVDAHLRHPVLHRMFAPKRQAVAELTLDGLLQIRPTGWPGLELASCCPVSDDAARDRTMQQIDGLLNSYRAAVVDLGVSRLDARMLPLARPTDPILLVVRYGHTERRDLVTTTAALRAANRSVAGVILNGASEPVRGALKRFLG